MVWNVHWIHKLLFSSFFCCFFVSNWQTYTHARAQSHLHTHHRTRMHTLLHHQNMESLLRCKRMDETCEWSKKIMVAKQISWLFCVELFCILITAADMHSSFHPSALQRYIKTTTFRALRHTNPTAWPASSSMHLCTIGVKWHEHCKTPQVE